MRNPVTLLRNRMLKKQLPHNCFTCNWFTMREKKPHIKVCKFPGDIGRPIRGVCRMWDLQVEPAKRQRSFIQ